MGKRYLDADKIYNFMLYDDEYEEWELKSMSIIDLVNISSEHVIEPEEDVVEVVRCKYCIHDSYCCRCLNPYGRNESDYCSYGERREDAEIH